MAKQKLPSKIFAERGWDGLAYYAKKHEARERAERKAKK